MRKIVGKIDIKEDAFIQLGKGPFTASDLRNITKKNAVITKIRANIINYALWIEDFLDEIIEKVLFPGNKKPVFRQSIYEDLRFRKKGNIFKSIINNKIINLDKPDEIIRQVQEIINIRNDFAHGEVIFNHKKIYLKTLRGKKIELDDSYFNKANDKFEKALTTLNHILTELDQV